MRVTTIATVETFTLGASLQGRPRRGLERFQFLEALHAPMTGRFSALKLA